MPRPDHELIFGTTIADVVTKPGARFAVIALVEVRSDKAALDADDNERHTYGGAVRYVAHIGEGETYERVVRLAHRLGDGIETLSLFDELHELEPTPEPYMAPDSAHGHDADADRVQADADDWELPEGRPIVTIDGRVYMLPTAMAPVDLGDGRPAQDVKLEHLASVELSTGDFYNAVRMLKLGHSLADVTEGWTDDQRTYLASFIGPSTPTTTPRKPRAPRKAKP